MNKNSLLKILWSLDLCPFETVKQWKAGFSIKCPLSTRVSWTQRERDRAILKEIGNKRSGICIKCIQRMKDFAYIQIEVVKE